MITKRLKIINDLRSELNALKENYDDLIENDPLFQEVQEKEVELKEEKKASKTRLMTNETLQALGEEIKEKRREIKEHGEALSVELIELYRQSGVLEITDADGSTKRMKFNVKLVTM